MATTTAIAANLSLLEISKKAEQTKKYSLQQYADINNGAAANAINGNTLLQSPSSPQQSPNNNLGFRYVWPVKIQLRQLSANGENIILHISPKFATCHEHVSFQWTLKLHGTPETASLNEDDDDEQNGELAESDKMAANIGNGKKTAKVDNGKEQEEGEEEDSSLSSADKGYVAISLYYLDGPVRNVQLKAQVRIVGEKGAKRRDSQEMHALLEEMNNVSVYRGHECELAFKDRAHLSAYIRQNIGHVIRLSLLLEMDSALFRAGTYLNAVSPTPTFSFLTVNYRATVSSKVWRKRSNRRPRSASDGLHQQFTGNMKMDLERKFNLVMERERVRRELEAGSKEGSRMGSQRPSLNEGVAATVATAAAICDADVHSKNNNNNGNDANNNNNHHGSDDNTQQQQQEATTHLNEANQNVGNCCLSVPTPPQVVSLPSAHSPPQIASTALQRPPPESHLFKKLLVACCDSCERRASLIPLSMSNSGTDEEIMMCNESKKDDGGGNDADQRGADDDEEEEAEDEEEEQAEEVEEDGTTTEQCQGAEEVDTPFECDEENKAEIHDTLANMYFNKMVLPEMEYVEDFVDFLIDAELSDLPVLKRACERYLCGELNTKNQLMTSLILDLFFIAMVFQLPVMKSMTLTELCERYSELEDVEMLLQQEEYSNLDKRIRQLCGDRNLYDLVDECKRFREQCLRVQKVDLSKKGNLAQFAENGYSNGNGGGGGGGGEAGTEEAETIGEKKKDPEEVQQESKMPSKPNGLQQQQ